jgi:UDP-glucose 4-epimerase
MKIAITGGAGFVGSHLTKAYLDAGHDVLVIDNLAHGSRQDVDKRARFYQLDVRDPKVQHVLQQERPDVVSHHAAQHAAAFPEESLLADADVQLRGLLNVLEGCVEASVKKLIYASNGSTLYQPAPMTEAMPHRIHIVREDAPPYPQRPNDISKLAGEWYVRYYSQQYRLEHTILRYAHIYGESNSELAQHACAYFITTLSRKQRPIIRGSACDLRDHIYIDDVMRANLCALERGRNCTMHISTGQGYSLDQVFDTIATQFSSDLLPVYLAASHSEPTALILDNTYAQQQLGWQPEITFSEGIKQAIVSLCGQEVYASPEDAHELTPVKEASLVHV